MDLSIEVLNKENDAIFFCMRKKDLYKGVYKGIYNLVRENQEGLWNKSMEIQCN